jgi:hypothetical protein
VALYDVYHLLPTKKGRPQKPRPASARIERFYVHKSGGEGRDGFEGLLASARYVVHQRMLPGQAYPWWVSRKADRTPEGLRVGYRGVQDDRRSWHTGGRANDHGAALALQGDLSRRDLTEDQRIVAECILIYAMGLGDAPALYPHLDPRDPVSTHSRSKRYGGTGKSICPGEFAERWLDGWLAIAD